MLDLQPDFLLSTVEPGKKTELKRSYCHRRICKPALPPTYELSVSKIEFLFGDRWRQYLLVYKFEYFSRITDSLNIVLQNVHVPGSIPSDDK